MVDRIGWLVIERGDKPLQCLTVQLRFLHNILHNIVHNISLRGAKFGLIPLQKARTAAR